MYGGQLRQLEEQIVPGSEPATSIINWLLVIPLIGFEPEPQWTGARRIRHLATEASMLAVLSLCMYNVLVYVERSDSLPGSIPAEEHVIG